ncbi:MAG TPA: PhoPQ-activated pathogenicity protein [Rhodopirellula baltica]|uniref:PhoPQ-activated pathogenicity-related family protein n=1 Tax=Rhodopirellula baltica TaxID=265606 RepID=UPI00030AD26F|nr:PhoPQ-activated pathogenicity-related family protein [Rhodopirellula baltica]HBE61215.1 PhoPQ-activated pathogenicity protein [Rhodopirellula baltica]
MDDDPRHGILETVESQSVFSNQWVSGLLVLGAFLSGVGESRAEEIAPLETEAIKSDATQRLAEMVLKRDDSFRWDVRARGEIAGCDYVVIHLVSQTWQGVPLQHLLYILNPPEVDPKESNALLLISGGSWKAEWGMDGPDTIEVPREAALLASVALEVKTPVAILKQVPFQPMFDGLKEDALIAHTFQKFFETNDPDWPLLPVMARAASAAMDAVVGATKEEWGLSIDGFTVTGASKRGWTTYLVGATDPRVKAIAPMVIDMLNMNRQMKHQIDAWGAYSPQIEDYTRRGLQKMMGTPKGMTLLQLVDPYEHRASLTMPKLVLLGSNDPYWPADSTQHYFEELSGPTLLLNIPNNGHGLNDIPRMVGGVSALHRYVCEGRALPEWKTRTEKTADGLKIIATSDQVPAKVMLWTAKSRTRDLRSSIWESSPLKATEDGSWSSEVTPPTSGSSAAFIEAQYESAGTFPLSVTSQIHVLH